jgi:hypothetical protein
MPPKANNKNSQNGSKSASRARRRRAGVPALQASASRSKANGPNLSGAKRTPDSIIEKLSGGLSAMSVKQRHPYLHCRSDPFGASGRSHIPDGSNDQFVVVDAYSVDNVAMSQAQSTFYIQTTTTLPSMAMIFGAPSTNITVNGTAITPPASVQPDGNVVASARYPICMPAAYNLGIQPGNNINDPYSATKARLVSRGYRIIYTGPVNTCSGAITVTPNDYALAMGELTTSAAATPAAGTFSLNVNGATNAVSSTCAVGSMFLSTDLSIATNAMTRATRTFRPEEGLYLIPKHRSADFKISPVTNVPFGVVVGFSASTASAKPYTNLLMSNGTYAGGVIWFDNDWDDYLIQFSGINSDATFRIECITCIEYNPSASSNVAPMAQSAVKSEPNIMKQAYEQQAALPDARPLGRPR